MCFLLFAVLIQHTDIRLDRRKPEKVKNSSHVVEDSELGHAVEAVFQPATQWVLLFCLMMPEDVKCTVNLNVFYM